MNRGIFEEIGVSHRERYIRRIADISELYKIIDERCNRALGIEQNKVNKGEINHDI